MNVAKAHLNGAGSGGRSLMLWRMEQRADAKVLHRARQKLGEVREALSAPTEHGRDGMEVIINELADLGRTLHQAAQTGAILRESPGRQTR